MDVPNYQSLESSCLADGTVPLTLETPGNPVESQNAIGFHRPLLSSTTAPLRDPRTGSPHRTSEHNGLAADQWRINQVTDQPSFCGGQFQLQPGMNRFR